MKKYSIDMLKKDISKILENNNVISFTPENVFEIYNAYLETLCASYGSIEHVTIEIKYNDEKHVISFVDPIIPEIMMAKISPCLELLKRILSDSKPIHSLFSIGHPQSISLAFLLLKTELDFLSQKKFSGDCLIIIAKIKLLSDIHEEFQACTHSKNNVLSKILVINNKLLSILEKKCIEAKKFFEYTIILEEMIANAKTEEIKKNIIIHLVTFNKRFLPNSPDAYNNLIDDNESLFTPLEKESLKNEIFAISMQELKISTHPLKTAPPLSTEQMSFLISCKTEIPYGKYWRKVYAQ